MPESIEREECPLCAQLLGERHLPDCPVILDPPESESEDCGALLGELHRGGCPRNANSMPFHRPVTKSEAVTVRYVREGQAVPVTDEMVERAWVAGQVDRGVESHMFNIRPDWDKPALRAALDAALNGANDA